MSQNYRFKRDARSVEVFAANPAVDVVEMGDLVQWDTATKTAKRLASTANAAAFIGVAEGAIPPTSNIDNSTLLVTQLTVRKSGTFSYKTSVGDTLVNGDAVTIGADNQTVLKTATAGEVIGYADIPDGSSVVGAAGVLVDVRIRPNFPSPDFA